MDIAEAYKNRTRWEDDPLLRLWFERIRKRTKAKMTVIMFLNDKQEEVLVRYHPANTPPQTLKVKPHELVNFVMATDLILVKQWESGVILLQDRKTVPNKDSKKSE